MSLVKSVLPQDELAVYVHTCVCHVLLCWALTSQTPERSHLSQKFTLLKGEVNR